MAGVDSRGVKRGNCLSCFCEGYDGGPEKKKCVGCDHPPGKHTNLTPGQPHALKRSDGYAAPALQSNQAHSLSVATIIPTNSSSVQMFSSSRAAGQPQPGRVSSARTRPSSAVVSTQSMYVNPVTSGE